MGDMMSAETILKMIEAVDPSDTGKLFEIDKAVHVFLLPEDKAFVDSAMRFEIRDYTRSRDALKSIRPKDWLFDISNNYKSASCHGTLVKYDEESPEVLGDALPNEELAELHAIIQAIAYERSQK